MGPWGAGTNVMIRARAAFQVCRYAETNAQADVTRPLGAAAPDDRRQIYAEDEISEDVELGARMHAHGYKSVIVGERLASGEVCWAVNTGASAPCCVTGSPDDALGFVALQASELVRW